MSYIDNSKMNLLRENFMLTQENEILRNKIKNLKKELNELLDNSQCKAKENNNDGYVKPS